MRKLGVLTAAAGILLSGQMTAAELSLNGNVAIVCDATVLTALSAFPIPLMQNSTASGSVFIQCNGGEGVDVRLNSSNGQLASSNDRTLDYQASLDLGVFPNGGAPLVLTANGISPGATGDVEVVSTIGGSAALATGLEVPVNVEVLSEVIFGGTYVDTLTVEVITN